MTQKCSWLFKLTSLQKIRTQVVIIPRGNFLHLTMTSDTPPSSIPARLPPVLPYEPSDYRESTTGEQARRNQLQGSPVWLFFDGECASCHAVVQFLLRRKHRGRFRFAPQQILENSPARLLMSEHAAVVLHQSLIVWKQGVTYTRSTAALILFSELEFPFCLLALLWIVPRLLRDACYNWYARHRYQLFGKATTAQCAITADQGNQSLIATEWCSSPLLFPKSRPVFLTADWRNLIIINYAVPKALLEPYVPQGLELDDWHGTVLMSLVAFSFIGTSFGGIAALPYADFEEVNLRFYVRRLIPGVNGAELRRGVVFIKELVPFRLVAQIARCRYGERYAHTAITYSHETQQHSQSFHYTWGTASPCTVTATVAGAPHVAPTGTLGHFITEHYYGYVRTFRGGCQEYEVEHPPWKLWSAPDVALSGPLAQWYPPELAAAMTQPHSALVAIGSPVRVLHPTTLIAT